jgi:hypothetical protein
MLKLSSNCNFLSIYDSTKFCHQENFNVVTLSSLLILLILVMNDFITDLEKKTSERMNYKSTFHIRNGTSIKEG